MTDHRGKAGGRSYLKGWQDKRPGWTRRVRWYQGREDVRLQFEERAEDGTRHIAHRVYKDTDAAQMDFELFTRDLITVDMLLEEQYGGEWTG